MRVLMLLTDAFGGHGGISKFNRDFLTALDASPVVERIFAWPRLIAETITEPLPQSIVYERKFAAGKGAFLKHAAGGVIMGPPIDLVICGHLNLLPAAWAVARTRRVPLALIIHGIDAWAPTRNPLTNFLAGRIDALISVSKVSADRFRAWSGVSQESIYILPNSVDLERFTPGPKPQELVTRYGLQGSRVLLTVGRLASEERYKGFDEVLEILPQLLRRYENVKYMIAGHGPDAPRLKAKAAALGVTGSVIFTGRISEEEKVGHYRLGDLYVMPSSGEGFGIVLIEAAACGLPVIGSKVDGSAEALLQGRLGTLVNPRNRDEILQAVTSALDAEAACKKRCSDVEYFSWNAFVSRVHEWIRQMCSVSRQQVL
jgi:phosphatidyl-myo-inositol dimannoside synthase